MRLRNDPSRRVRSESCAGVFTAQGYRPLRSNHTLPYGTVLFLNLLQAVNCEATITWSLRDRDRSTRCPQSRLHIRQVEDEDDDEYEYENRRYFLGRDRVKSSAAFSSLRRSASSS